jgi:hypothetical protein
MQTFLFSINHRNPHLSGPNKPDAITTDLDQARWYQEVARREVDRQNNKNSTKGKEG